MSKTTQSYHTVQDFQRIHQQAVIRDLLGGLTRAPVDLLSYQEVRSKLHVQETSYRQLTDIALDQIVGSVGRYRDFTRAFLPRNSASQGRWIRIKELAGGMVGWPPIEVYQVDRVYFVQDGNHRVSVANEMGMKTIQAYVTRCILPVTLSADATPTDLIVKADHAGFLRQTQLDNLRPDHAIEFTVPGQFHTMLAHIAAHQFFMEQTNRGPVTWEEAVVGWYDGVYLPMLQLIKEKDLLKEFPYRTAADLYAWAVVHEMDLRQTCGVPGLDDSQIIENFVSQHSERLGLAQFKAIKRLFGRVFGSTAPPCENERNRP